MRAWITPTLGIVIIFGTPLAALAAGALCSIELACLALGGYVAAATAPSWVGYVNGWQPQYDDGSTTRY